MFRHFAIICFKMVLMVPAFTQVSGRASHAAFAEKIVSPRELSLTLTAGKHSEYEKVTSIFLWITENIAYRSRMISKRNAVSFLPEEDTSLVLKPLNERVSEIVLRNGVAVCDGYARLFKTLCDHAGIRAEIITGFVRNEGRASLRFQTNHSWNAVMIEGKWYLADATWASGHINYAGQFIRNYDAGYFLADPASMLRTHYPENPVWTLMRNHKAPSEFRSQPLKYFSWHSYYIDHYTPSSGIINVKEGQPVTIAIHTREEKKDLVFSTDPLGLMLPGIHPDIQRSFTVEGPVIKGIYEPGPGRPQWLYVALNGEIVMRYQLRYETL